MMQLLVLILNLVPCDVHWKNMRIVVDQTICNRIIAQKLFRKERNCIPLYIFLVLNAQRTMDQGFIVQDFILLKKNINL